MPSRAVVGLKLIPQTWKGTGFPTRKVIGSDENSHVDPFIVLEHFGPIDYGPGEALGAPDHPHRGFEICTYIIDGAVEHKDTAEGSGILGPGWVQLLTVGKGIVHSEMPTEQIIKEGGKVEGFQLWVNLPNALKMLPPKHQDTSPDQIPVVETEDGKTSVKVLVGEAMGKSSPIKTKTDVLLLDVRISKGGEYTHPLPKSYHGLVYCWRGEGSVGSADVGVKVGHVALLSESEHGDSITMKASASEDCYILLVCGEPIKEPIIRSGPFVMTTQKDINWAHIHHADGVFGTIPGEDERLKQYGNAVKTQKDNGTWRNS